MNYWLMKSEPDAYSWQQLVKDGRTSWNGVRNYLANNNMKAMKVGDKSFFYHSNELASRGGPAIVGIMKVIKLWHPDPADPSGRFGMVDVAPVRPLSRPITLKEIKSRGWNLNPGRYVGAAEGEADTFDFSERLQELQEEFERLNADASGLQERIAKSVAEILV